MTIKPDSDSDARAHRERTANYQTVLLRGTADSLHPANAGYKLMGDVWYGAVKVVLP